MNMGSASPISGSFFLTSSALPARLIPSRAGSSDDALYSLAEKMVGDRVSHFTFAQLYLFHTSSRSSRGDM
jgi:hypothetical protein